ncbi:MarR family transcriptional regulator [Candidatus Uhrbacteria bacterium]|nr:MAG: MarR family transcriptional regulator [Candidatus Uhrbacteria bacterium]
MTAPQRARQPDPEHDALRLWLRLFTCSTMIAQHVGSALKREFGSSLARFDLLAQLDRAPAGLRMGELSERTLTTGGNVTWLVRALEAEGLVTRRVAAADRRAAVVRLTPAGRRHFAVMARAHERWIRSIFSSLAPADRRDLHALLGTVKQGFRPSRTPE